MMTIGGGREREGGEGQGVRDKKSQPGVQSALQGQRVLQGQGQPSERSKVKVSRARTPSQGQGQPSARSKPRSRSTERALQAKPRVSQRHASGGKPNTR